jgi:sugar/nucleoside kinase (ribokinase family)
MTETNIDVVGIGNAVVDVIAHADDAFLARETLVKGTMTLIDAPRAEALFPTCPPPVSASGEGRGCGLRRRRKATPGRVSRAGCT